MHHCDHLKDKYTKVIEELALVKQELELEKYKNAELEE